MASTVDAVADYIYPLEPSGQRYLVDGRPAEAVNMLHRAAIGDHVGYLIAQNYGRLKRGDRIWFRASKPEQRIVAMGVVQAPAYCGTSDERWYVLVSLDFEATQRLHVAQTQPTIRAARRAVWSATDAEVRALSKIAGT